MIDRNDAVERVRRAMTRAFRAPVSTIDAIDFLGDLEAEGIALIDVDVVNALQQKARKARLD